VGHDVLLVRIILNDHVEKGPFQLLTINTARAVFTTLHKFFDLLVYFLGVIQVDVAHGLTMVELLRLKEAGLDLSVEFVGLICGREQEFEILQHDWFKLEQDLHVLLLQLVHFVAIEYFINRRLRTQLTEDVELETTRVFFAFLVAEDQTRCLILLHEWLQISLILVYSDWTLLVKIDNSRGYLIIIELDTIEHLSHYTPGAIHSLGITNRLNNLNIFLLIHLLDAGF